MMNSLYDLIERKGYPSRGQAPEIYATRLNISGRPQLAMASCNASMQKSDCKVIDTASLKHNVCANL